MNADPVMCYRANVAQKRFYSAIANPKPESLTVVLFLKGNRAGGSWGLLTAWSAIMFGTAHPLFQRSPFGRLWPFRRSARLAAPIGSLGDKGPIQTAITRLFPPGRYEMSKGMGHGYFSQGSADTGWDFDMVTYDQDPLQVAGANKGLILTSEPPNQPTFVELLTRLSGNGMMISEMTRLDMATFIEEYVDAGALILDGKKVGEVRVVTADIHDSCREHSGGHQSHSAIEATIAGWPAEEREARRTGKALRLSGRIYPSYGDHNEISEMPDYHQACWDSGQVRIANLIDPHDSRPWFVVWIAAFPNSDAIAFAEWPNLDFRACKVSPITDIEDYRNPIAESEVTIGLPTVNRGMDSGHMYTPGKGNAKTIDIMLRGPCRRCMVAAGAGLDDDDQSDAYQRASQSCTHKLAFQGWPVYSGSINHGHTLVRPNLGGSGQRPKFYVMDSCPNTRYALRHYAYKVEKNPERAAAERASYINKDGADVVAGFYKLGFQDWPAEVRPLAVNPVRTGAPADPRVSQPPERLWPVVRAKVKGLNLNPVRHGGPANQDPRR